MHPHTLCWSPEMRLTSSHMQSSKMVHLWPSLDLVTTFAQLCKPSSHESPWFVVDTAVVTAVHTRDALILVFGHLWKAKQSMKQFVNDHHTVLHQLQQYPHIAELPVRCTNQETLELLDVGRDWLYTLSFYTSSATVNISRIELVKHDLDLPSWKLGAFRPDA